MIDFLAWWVVVYCLGAAGFYFVCIARDRWQRWKRRRTVEIEFLTGEEPTAGWLTDDEAAEYVRKRRQIHGRHW